MCSDSGWELVSADGSEQVKRCQCWVKKTQQAKLAKIPAKFIDSTFASYHKTRFKQPDGKILTLSKAMQEIRSSYLLSGEVGLGKTHLLMAQYRALTEAGFYSTTLVREVDLIRNFQAAQYHARFGGQEQASSLLSLETFLAKNNYTHIFIDDLGKTPVTDDRTYQFFALLDLIYMRRWGLTITTNYRIADLEKRWPGEYAPMIVRRLQDICQPIYMFERR